MKKKILAIILVLVILICGIVVLALTHSFTPKHDSDTTEVTERLTAEDINYEPLTTESNMMTLCKHSALTTYFYDYKILDDKDSLFWQGVVAAITEDNPYNLDEYGENWKVEANLFLNYLEAMHPNAGELPPYPAGVREALKNGERVYNISPCPYGDMYGAEVVGIDDADDSYVVHIKVFDYDKDEEFDYDVTCTKQTYLVDGEDIFDYCITDTVKVD